MDPKGHAFCEGKSGYKCPWPLLIFKFQGSLAVTHTHCVHSIHLDPSLHGCKRDYETQTVYCLLCRVSHQCFLLRRLCLLPESLRAVSDTSPGVLSAGRQKNQILKTNICFATSKPFLHLLFWLWILIFSSLSLFPFIPPSVHILPLFSHIYIYIGYMYVCICI